MFINLKLHTDYTLLEGVAKIENYVEKAKKLGVNSIGVSDKNLSSAMKLYNICKKENINLVLGLEVYIYGINLEGKYALNIYAIGDVGYKSLIKLANLSYLKHDILDIKDILEAKNVIILSGGINSEIYKLIEKLDLYNAKNTLLEYQKIPNFYLELPCFSMPKKCVEKYVEFAKELNVKLVATNDTYYLEKEDASLQKIVSAIRENTTVKLVKNYYTVQDLYFKTENEIRQNLNFIDEKIVNEAILNTEYISKLCTFNFAKRENNLPKLNLDISEGQYLKNLVYSKLSEKYEKNYSIAKKRVDTELEVIDKMGFSAYFLIVYDIVNYAKNNNIMVGPGRGSAAGCIISYILGITSVDPIKYDLMFERFLNSGRKNMPDIDLDFETTKKDKVIQYVMNKYGKDYVANIITFSTMKEKQIKKDLSRVFRCNENSSTIKPYIPKLLGNVRHSSIHASGLVITREKLENIVPVNRVESLNINISQYQMEELESMGLLKIDFLSLANLDVIASTIKLTNLKLSDIPLEDEDTFKTYNAGKTLGIFQVESRGITELIKRYRINNFFDISIVLALYRPGPLKSGMVNHLIDVKNKGEKITYLLDDLEDILKSTYGVIIYQEQIMQIAKKIAGFTLNEADDLRRAISKKKIEILEKYKNKFIKFSIENGYDREKIIKLYDQIEKFGEYGFNKAHTIPYAMLSYYTAYFKTHYTKEFVVSILNSQLGIHDKLQAYCNILREKNIGILLPDVNNSDEIYIIQENCVRYGLYSISNISLSLSKDIVCERQKNGKYIDIIDFVYRMQKYSFTIRQFEVLAKVGAFDLFSITRRELVENAKEIFSIAMKRKKIEDDVCIDLFFESNMKKEKYIIKNTKEYSLDEKLKYEKELLGIMISLPKNSIVNVIVNKNSYDNGYIFNVKGKWVKFDDIYKLKDSVINILLDGLDDKKRESLKKIIKQRGGYSKVRFYENKTRLNMKKPIYFDIRYTKNLIELIGEKNIKIFLNTI